GMLKGGFAVPLYVLILSVVGAVISMLLELPDFLRDYEAIHTGAPDESARASTLSSEVLKYFVYILTGPFLGMIAYSLASLLASTSVFVLSVVAFSVGFISDALVEAMVSFATGILNRARATAASPPAAGPAGAAGIPVAPPLAVPTPPSAPGT